LIRTSGSVPVYVTVYVPLLVASVYGTSTPGHHTDLMPPLILHPFQYLNPRNIV
jgi:hypothetical protein